MTIEGLPPAARKAELRKGALAARDLAAAMPGAAEAAAAAVAQQALAASMLASRMSSGIVAGYWPIRSELDPRPLMRALAARGADLALPVVTPGGLVFRRWDEAAALEKAGFGTLGPAPDSPERAPDVLLLPLAAFDLAGNRLGYGQGHYDGAIARLTRERTDGERPFIVGIGYDAQLFDAIPREPHDQPLDAIVTPLQSIIVNNAAVRSTG